MAWPKMNMKRVLSASGKDKARAASKHPHLYPPKVRILDKIERVTASGKVIEEGTVFFVADRWVSIFFPSEFVSTEMTHGGEISIHSGFRRVQEWSRISQRPIQKYDKIVRTNCHGEEDVAVISRIGPGYAVVSFKPHYIRLKLNQSGGIDQHHKTDNCRFRCIE